jgi:predicted phage terminase large subunit-like protein
MAKRSRATVDTMMEEEAILKREALNRARSGHLMTFTKMTYSQYETAWHHRLTAEYLTKFARREIDRLIIFEPPQHGKSELASRRLPAMLMGMYPNDAILACSYNGDLASDMTIDVQRIMDTDTYHEIFPGSIIMPDGKMGKYSRSSNEHELIPYKDEDKYWHFPKGNYRSAGVDGSFTGRPGDWLLIDDPYKNRASADSKSNRDMILKNYSSTLKTRLRGQGQILIMHTRWHEDDLAGNLMRLADNDPNADKWTILVLPAILDSITNKNSKDPREIGDVLWPERFPMKILLANKANSERDFSALYQQSPTAEGGNIIKTEWIKYWDFLPPRFDAIIQSWDFAVKDKTTSDYTVGQVWGKLGADKFLIHQVRGKWSFPDACKKVVEVSNMFPKAGKKLVEAKANGPAVIQTLKKHVPGLVESEPVGDKVARLNAVAPDYQSGNVWYPDPAKYPWVREHIQELCGFPSAQNDDVVDAASQALNELRHQGPVYMPTSGHGSGTIY